MVTNRDLERIEGRQERLEGDVQLLHRDASARAERDLHIDQQLVGITAELKSLCGGFKWASRIVLGVFLVWVAKWVMSGGLIIG